jgi:hypothetical protein
MENVLKSRIAFLSALFSAGGAALTRLFVTDNIGWDITAIAWIISLLVSLFVSGLFRHRIKRRTNIVISSILFVCSMASLAFYMTRTTNLVCEFQTFSDTTATIQIVHGTSSDYTPEADTFIKYTPVLANDPCALLDSFGRVNTDVWTLKGINTAKQQLMLTYFIFVAFFVACITYLCEYLSQQQQKVPGDGNAKT